MRESINVKDLIADRYGKEGTKEREKFREDAFSFYFGEIIKNRRKELHMSQENLAEICSIKGKEEQRFLESNWSELENIPYNIDSQSNLFCNCVQAIQHSTHTIYVGEVTGVINKNTFDPLLYKDGNYLD